MLTYLYSNLFDSPAQTLVNTVNTVGIMGKGIAKSFRERYPKMFSEYRKLCDEKILKTGNLHLWKGDDHWILNFPTKTTWRLPSEIDYIERGLKTFVQNYENMGVISASFPPLGCGNGNLNWDDVRPIMERHLSNLSIPIYIHSLHVGAEFVPEHREMRSAPKTLEGFWSDLRTAIHENKGTFATIEGSTPYSISVADDSLVIVRGGRQREKIPVEEIEHVWVVLRDGILSVDKFSDDRSRKFKSYLYPILKSLPYVRSAPITKPGQQISNKSLALYFPRSAGKSEDARVAEPEQICLSL